MGPDMHCPLLNRRGLPAALQFEDEGKLARPLSHEAELLVAWRTDFRWGVGEVSRVDERDAVGECTA